MLPTRPTRPRNITTSTSRTAATPGTLPRRAARPAHPTHSRLRLCPDALHRYHQEDRAACNTSCPERPRPGRAMQQAAPPHTRARQPVRRRARVPHSFLLPQVREQAACKRGRGQLVRGYVCTCTHARTRARTFARMLVCMRANVRACVRACAHVHMWPLTSCSLPLLQAACDLGRVARLRAVTARGR